MRGVTERGIARAGALLSAPWAPVVAVLALAAVFIAQSAFTVNGEVFFSLSDDAMISMRYARNLVDGHGLVWNPGDAPVEGYSNLLWTLWMAALHLLRLADAKASLPVMLSGAGILAANVVAVRRLVGAIAPDATRAVTLAGWLVALDHSLACWTLRGFEVGLVALQVSVAALLAVRLAKGWSRRTLAALAAVMALGVLTRDDTLPVWGVVAAYVGVCGPRGRGWRGALWLAGAAAGAFAAHAALRAAYYGALLPNTYTLKMGGIPAVFRWRRGLRTLGEAAAFCLPGALGVIASAVVRGRSRAGGGESAGGESAAVESEGGQSAAVESAGGQSAGRESVRGESGRGGGGAGGRALLGGIFLVVCLYSVHVGGDSLEHEVVVNRFVSAALPAFLALAALSLDALLSGGGRGVARRTWLLAAGGLFVVAAAWNLHAHVRFGGAEGLRAGRIAAALAVVGVAGAAYLRGTRAFGLAGVFVVASQGPAWVWSMVEGPLWAEEDALVATYGVALGAATPEDAKVAVTWAGAIPYFARRRGIDLFGKCDAVIAREPPRPGPLFAPGHNKWDLAHSVGVLRPDVIAQVTEDDAASLWRIEGWGYERVGPEVFLRSGAGIERASLLRAACVIPWSRTDLWGFLGDDPAVWRARWAQECGPPSPAAPGAAAPGPRGE